MTSKHYIERGVEKVRDTFCGTCINRMVHKACGIIACMDDKSKHYGHILTEDHPACKRYYPEKGKA